MDSILHCLLYEEAQEVVVLQIQPQIQVQQIWILLPVSRQPQQYIVVKYLVIVAQNYFFLSEEDCSELDHYIF